MFNFALSKIADFSRKQGDSISLELDALPALRKLGPLNKKYFDSGNNSADDGNDYIIYHKKAGRLYYDADGNDVGEAVLFAELAAKTKLRASDIDVI